MAYIHFSDEQIAIANQIDLESFLRSKGEILLKSGRDKRLKSDRSVTIRGNTWFDHSKEIGGYPIDFIKFFYRVDFTQAMEILLSETNLSYYKTENINEPQTPFALPTNNKNNDKLIQYMTKHRGISPTVLDFFISKNLIYESCETIGSRAYHNAVFVGLDSENKPKHAQKRNLNVHGKRFVQNIAGSLPKHSFNYLGGGENLYVFEAPIDMLSFISINENTDWHKQNYVALCGTSSHAMVEVLEKNININHVNLCLDNDKTGHQTVDRFQKLLREIGVDFDVIVPSGKDFNEDLIATEKDKLLD